MKTNFLKRSVISYVLAFAFYIALSSMANPAFSQSISNDMNMFSNPDDWHQEAMDYGAGSKQYKWKMTAFGYGSDLWAFDNWTPMGLWGEMGHSYVERERYVSDAYYSNQSTQGYGTYFPGSTYTVSVSITEHLYDYTYQRWNDYWWIKSHNYVVTYN